ncbi:MAG: biopolymer transporter ExbD [Myxococcales bacterium]|nr:biopolymer transporter ExbD [Myxococcales bacterium]
MAGISTGGGSNGRKPLDQEIPLIPFIDLLLCCVMFLLVTAVWNQLAAIDANQQVPGQQTEDAPPPDQQKVRLVLQVEGSGYVLASTAGERMPIPKEGGTYDRAALRDKLAQWHALYTDRQDMIVAPEDGVKYEDVVAAMDVAIGAGFPNIALSDSASLM